MGDQDDSSTRLIGFPPIPRAGLAEVLASWTGRGSLYEALSVPLDARDDRRWTSADVQQRANRVLLSKLEPALRRWPKRTGEWLDHLPASKSRTRVVKPFPFAGVAWAQSRRSYGWPPSAFVGKESERGADMLAVQVLRWCADRLDPIWADSLSVSPDLTFGATAQVKSVLKLLEHEPLSSASAIAPTRSDLTALRREGAPWGSVAAVAQVLLNAERSTDFLLYELLIPDDEIRWRLFHLAVLGVLLMALRDAGCSVTSSRPLSAKSGSPNYDVVASDGGWYGLWFEASGVWGHLGQQSPFVEATRGIDSRHRSNGADLLLLAPGRQALVIECKYSWNTDNVARAGYYQAMAYGVEVRSRLADVVLSIAVGPEIVVPQASHADVSFGRVATAPPSALAPIVDGFLGQASLPQDREP